MDNPNKSILEQNIAYKSRNALETDLVLSKKNILKGRTNEHEEEESNPDYKEEESNPDYKEQESNPDYKEQESNLHDKEEIDESFPEDEIVQPRNESEGNDSLVSYVLGGVIAPAPSSGEDLAVAVAVQDEPKLIFFAHEVDLDDSIPLHKSKTFWFCASIAIIVVVAATIGSTLATTKALEESIRYTSAPSVSASSSPSTSRDGLGIWQQLDQVSSVNLMLALDIDTDEEDTLNTVYELRNTSQFRAANWIINEDYRQLSRSDPTILQRYALAVIYFSTYGENWTSTREFYNTSNATYDFLNDEDECTWYGVTCENSILIGLELSLNDLSGTIPEEIGLLDQLTSLLLSENYLYGQIPSMIGALAQLTALSFSDNLLTGHIPESFYNLNQIDTFEVLFNYLSGTISERIANLTNVKGIFIEVNDFSGTLPDGLKDLPQLRYLRIDYNYFSGTLPSFNNDKLREIYVANNLFSGTIPSTIGIMKNLAVLDLDNNQFEGTLPEEIFKCKRLVQLRASVNDLSGTISTSIGQLSRLAYLDFSGNQFYGTIPEEIGLLENSIDLILRNNNLSGSIPSNLNKLTELEKLYLHYNPDIRGEVSSEICDLIYHHNLLDLSTDCLDIFQDPPVQCDCCHTCCDSTDEKCIFVISTPVI